MAQGPSDTILVAIRITLQIRESKVRNPDPPDRRRFVLSECSLVINTFKEINLRQSSFGLAMKPLSCGECCVHEAYLRNNASKQQQ